MMFPSLLHVIRRSSLFYARQPTVYPSLHVVFESEKTLARCVERIYVLALQHGGQCVDWTPTQTFGRTNENRAKRSPICACASE